MEGHDEGAVVVARRGHLVGVGQGDAGGHQEQEKNGNFTHDGFISLLASNLPIAIGFLV